MITARCAHALSDTHANTEADVRFKERVTYLDASVREAALRGQYQTILYWRSSDDRPRLLAVLEYYGFSFATNETCVTIKW